MTMSISAQDHTHEIDSKLLDYIQNVNQGTIQKDTLKGSPKREVSTANIHITYSSPGVKGRTIWGGLVAFDQVWVTGAHRATIVEFEQPVRIEGKMLEAGKYGFFTIPGKEEWVIIFNSRWDQHLADDYRASEDILRFKVHPQPQEFIGRLTYSLQEESNATLMSVSWDKLKVEFKIEKP